jgi:transposase-like protein
MGGGLLNRPGFLSRGTSRRRVDHAGSEDASVRLINERGVSYAQASQDLDVHQSQLRSWVKMLAAAK